MKNKNIILLSIYVVIFISLVIYTTIPNEYREVKKNLHFVRILDANRADLFQTMADIENYPKILSNNVISTSIYDKGDDYIISMEKIKEAGVTAQLKIKHTIIPYTKHTIEILDGDAKDTVITLYFEGNDSLTTLTIDVDLHTRGVLVPFSYLGQSNYDSAVNTILNQFVEYLDNKQQDTLK